MHFTKYHISGKDYIYCPEKNDFEKLTKNTITGICNRHSGVGADGIFTFYQNSSKTSIIKGFNQSGECMRNYSSAAICALFELFLTAGVTEHTFLSENGSKFAVKTDNSASPPAFFCKLTSALSDGIFGTKAEKTEIGNRILTVTPVNLHGIYAVHFTECSSKLDISYLGQHISKHSLFKKSGNLILAEKTDKNSLNISFYENGTGCPRPEISAFAATALAACRNKSLNYGEEADVSCNGNAVFITCETQDTVTIRCTCKRAFEGEIAENPLQQKTG